MQSDTNPEKESTGANDWPPFAVALGGLAGSNAHGAGCLQALLDLNQVPSLISCTSGQIVWVSKYLNALNNNNSNSVRKCFVEEQEKQRPAYNAREAITRAMTDWFEKHYQSGTARAEGSQRPSADAGRLDDKDAPGDEVTGPATLASVQPLAELTDQVSKVVGAYTEKLLENNLKTAQEKWGHTALRLFLHDLDYTMASVFCFGFPGKYKTPWSHVSSDFLTNLTSAWVKLLTSSESDVYAWKQLTNLWPGRLLQPEMFELMVPSESGRKPWKQAIADALNNPNACNNRGFPIGIIFNSFDVRHGTEYVHLNDRARTLLGVEERDLGKRNCARNGPHDRQHLIYEGITADMVKDALWLNLYGFDEATVARVDGAYYRQMILSELAKGLRNATAEESAKVTLRERSRKDADCDNLKIFVVRPVKNEWIGDYPKTFNDVRDFETRVSFNGAYAGERDRLLLINRLLREEKEKMEENYCFLGEKYKIIDIFEFEPTRQCGFYGYTLEDQELFDESQNKFTEVMKRNGYHERKSSSRT